MISKSSSLNVDMSRYLIIWSAGLVIGLLYLAGDVSRALSDEGLFVAAGTLIGRDFINVYTGGQITLAGDLNILYNLSAYRTYQDTLFDVALAPHYYSYPPPTLFYAWIFGILPYAVAYAVWTTLTGAAFAWAARPYLSEARLPTWIVLLLPASLMNIWAGHYGFLIGALWLGAWHLLETRPRTAGILIGLMLVKPHLALLIPLLLVYRRAWRAFGAATITVILLVTLSGMIFGWELWRHYLTETLFTQAALVESKEQFFLRMMPTIVPSLTLMGVAGPIAWAAQIGVALVSIIALIKWMPAKSRQAGLAAAVATFLVLPYAFNYDMTVFSIAALLAVGTAGNGGLMRRLALSSAFLIPVIVVAFNMGGIPVAPILIAYLLAFLLHDDQRSHAKAYPGRPTSSASASPI